jgi:lipid-A-disaccharide synthase
VVCYETPLPLLIGWARKKLLKVKYISLVNLIADSEVVTELVADTFSVENIRRELQKILDGPARETMLQGYDEVIRRLGDQKAPDNAASIMYQLLNHQTI